MASGNFLIGYHNLSLAGFNKYVEPSLEKRGYSVQDRIAVVAPNESQGRVILTSIVGGQIKDLEREINAALIEAGEEIERGEAQKPMGERVLHVYVSVYSHHEGEGPSTRAVNKGAFQMIGVYKGDKTASDLFPSLAQKYLLEEVEQKAESVVEEVKALLGKKLSDL